MRLPLGFPILLVAAVSCAPRAAVPFPFAERIGWLHGPCLAISNPKLTPKTRLTLVIAGQPQKVEQARIQEKTTSPQTCKALLEGRAAANAKPGISFYALEKGSAGSTDMGFGIVSPPSTPTVVDGLARIDLDQDGHTEVFSSCATTEGIKFFVWTERPYRGEPRWSGYYYLDYEMKPTCP